MKKIFAVLLTLILLCACLTGCGNRAGVFDRGEFNFTHIHFTDAVEGHCATVTKWYDNESSGIEVKTKEYGSLFLSESTYIMIEDAENCPYCGK